MEQSEAASRGKLVVGVNGQSFEFDDSEVLGREILTVSGYLPPTEHILIQVRDGRSRLLGPDDRVDLRQARGAVFRAFPGDRAWTFTLNEIGQVWGSEMMDVSELRSLWTVPDGWELVLEREDEPDIVLTEGGVVSFAPGGVEDIVSRPPRPGFVLVSVVTTAGVFPTEGSLRVKASVLISEVIERARRALNIVPGADWIVTVGSSDINPALTFEAAGLSGTVELFWGPREGGGGA